MVNSFSLIKKMVQKRQGKVGGGSGGGGSSNYFYTPPQSYFDQVFTNIKKELIDVESLTIEKLEKHIDTLMEERNFKRYGYGKLSNKENQQRLTYLAFARRTLAKMYEKLSGEEYLQALELDDKDPIALEYMGELFIQMNKIEKIDEEKVIERLRKNGAENELKLLEDALCVWKNETDANLRSFIRFDLSCPEPFINLTNFGYTVNGYITHGRNNLYQINLYNNDAEAIQNFENILEDYKGKNFSFLYVDKNDEPLFSINGKSTNEKLYKEPNIIGFKLQAKPEIKNYNGSFESLQNGKKVDSLLTSYEYLYHELLYDEFTWKLYVYE
jgi:uncharacterized protein YlbG (UPF0298 family)